jgi:hypothetical protein
MRDLGLGYEAAMHGVQSAVRYEMTQRGLPDSGAFVDMLKHLRAGVDARASDALGLAELLIKKGLITGEEYIEHLRLAANEELARYEAYIKTTYGLPDNVSFR